MSIPLVFGAVSAGAALLSSLDADANSKTEHANATEMARRQRLAAKESALTQYGQLGRREAEEAQAAAAEIEGITRDARSAIGTATVALSSSGVAGESAGELLDEYERQAAEYASSVLISERSRRQALSDAKAGVSADLRAQHNATEVPPRRRLNLFTTALSVAGAGLQGYSAAGGKFASADTGLPKAPAGTSTIYGIKLPK